MTDTETESMHESAPPVKLAIVGCGAITRSAHLPAVLRSPLVELHALVDVNADSAAKLAREFSLHCRVARDLGEVVGEVDGVLVATPNHTHAAVAEVALSRGVPALIEKPLTTTHADALRLCDLAERHGTFVSVGFRSRHWAGVRLLKKLLDDGTLGTVRRFSYEVGNTGSWNSVSGYSVQAEQAGGGTLIDSHVLDKLIYWFGEPAAFTYADDNLGGVEANCKGTLSFRAGGHEFGGTFFISKTIELANRLRVEADRYDCTLAESEAGVPVLKARDADGYVFEVRGEDAGRAPTPGLSFRQQVDEFARAVRSGAPVTVPGRFAALSVKWTEAMYRARTQLEEPWVVAPR